MIGERGPKGDHGQAGDQGETGNVGERGAVGRGERGDQGQRGDVGALGERGMQGDIGQTGATGVPGVQGERGQSFLNFRWMQVAALALVVIAAAIAVYLIEDAANDKQRDAALRACETAKLDRIDVARAATAQSIYLQKVLIAASVKADVKRAASDSIQLWAESANQLRGRLYDCQQFVDDGKKVIDRAALLEARGKL